MGLKKATSTATATMKKQGRKSPHASRRPSRSEGDDGCHRSAARIDGVESVSDKLEALKNLVPSENKAEIKPDQLFKETADYIVKLETQVFVLQKLIDFYGSQQSQENRNSV